MVDSSHKQGQLAADPGSAVTKPPVFPFLLLTVFWTLVVVALAGWDYYQTYQSALANARTAARHSYAKDLSFRQWASGHGGVYVPVTPSTQPSPYLAHLPERDVLTSSGRALTLICPSYMFRQVHERDAEPFGIRAHITSRMPIRPENAPDAWEIQALQAFTRGTGEWSSLEKVGGETYLRLMRPIADDSGCLKCHAAQSHQGETVRGGISVSIPWTPYREALRASLPHYIWGYGGLWSLGLLGIGSSRRRLKNHLANRQQVEQALRQSEARYHSLFANHHSVMLLIDPEAARIVDANPAACAYYGYPYETLRGMKTSDINTLSPEQHQLEMTKAKSLARNRFEFQHRLAGGEIRDVEVFCGPVEFSEQQFLYSIIHDITERKRAEAALREERWRLRSIIEGTQVGTWEWNVQTGTTVFNETWAQILGYSLDELAPLSIQVWETLTHPDDLQQATERLERHFAGELPYYDCECRMKHKAGHWVWVQDRGRIMTRTVDGQPLMMFGTHSDITERKQAEAALRKNSEELRQRGAELERFTYAVSHDLKSPLVTIKAFLGFLEQDLTTGNTEKIAKDLDFMGTAANKMSNLLDELLRMSHIGRIVNDPTRMSFRELVQEVLALAAGHIAERNVAIRFGDEDLILFGDRPRLVEIWQNLLENAVKYMGDQPEPCIEIGLVLADDDTIFYVRDNGMGIEPRYVEKIFGLFEQLDKQSEGSGLGLALVKRIVELYSGRIWAESPGVGQGACFRFTLPNAVKNI